MFAKVISSSSSIARVAGEGSEPMVDPLPIHPIGTARAISLEAACQIDSPKRSKQVLSFFCFYINADGVLRSTVTNSPPILNP